jgi:hypothetical protein
MSRKNSAASSDAALRYTWVISPTDREMIDEVQQLGRFQNQRGLMQAAVALLAWTLREVKNKKIIVALDGNTGHYAELQMPAFENARRSGEKRLEPPRARRQKVREAEHAEA